MTTRLGGPQAIRFLCEGLKLLPLETEYMLHDHRLQWLEKGQGQTPREVHVCGERDCMVEMLEALEERIIMADNVIKP
jgi:hypothetical protein